MLVHSQRRDAWGTWAWGWSRSGIDSSFDTRHIPNLSLNTFIHKGGENAPPNFSDTECAMPGVAQRAIPSPTWKETLTVTQIILSLHRALPQTPWQGSPKLSVDISWGGPGVLIQAQHDLVAQSVLPLLPWRPPALGLLLGATDPTNPSFQVTVPQITEDRHPPVLSSLYYAGPPQSQFPK